MTGEKKEEADGSEARSEKAARREAVALAYREGDFAPRVVAKGSGLLADRILERAKEAGVYVHESRDLLALLMKVDLDKSIPAQLYVAVAELLAWLHRMEKSGPGDARGEWPAGAKRPGSGKKSGGE